MLLPKQIRDIFVKKPALVWYVKDKDGLSLESAVESILNYGDWQDFLILKGTIGIEKTNYIFENIKSRKRVNLRPATVNYFSKYFSKYA